VAVQSTLLAYMTGVSWVKADAGTVATIITEQDYERYFRGKEVDSPQIMTLVKSRSFDCGIAVLNYEPKRD
jgi:hypothetical protein